ncbi:MAG: MFS transporter [Galactobacter sp.]
MKPSTTAPSLWASSRYRRWLTADTGTQFGDAMTSFVLPLITLAATDDPAAAGIVAACGITARVLATLPGGSAADRHPRVRLMGWGGAIGLLLVLALLTLVLTDSLGWLSLLILNTTLGLTGGFFAPASNAALKNVVDAGALGRAQAANQGRDAAVSLAAAPGAGVLFGWGAWVVCLGIGAARLVTILGSLALGRSAKSVPSSMPDDAATPHATWSPEPAAAAPAVAAPTADPDHPTSGIAAPTTGYRHTLSWLWRRADLRATVIVATLINLAWGIVTTTVLYALQQRGTDMGAIGLVSSAMGAGMLVGALLAGPLIRRIPTGTLAVTGLILITAGAIALPTLHTVATVAPVMGLAVLGVPVLNAGLLGYVTVVTPETMIGKVTAVINFGAMLAMPLGPLIAGIGLAGPGRAATLWFGAGLCVLPCLMALASKALRSIPVESSWAARS